MKIWKETVPLPPLPITTREEFCGGNASLLDSLFFDIETTGFKADYCNIYLIGCAEFGETDATITLFFAEERHEEKAILEAFGALLEQKSQCFTFNGNRFDIPFIEKRCEKYDLALRPSKKACFDLFLYVKQFQHLLKLVHYKQKSLEEFLGIHRIDTYNGGELIEVYKHYLSNPNPEEETLLKQHNLDDVRGMLLLLPLLSYGYLYRKDNYQITNIESSEKEIVITGSIRHPLPQKLICSNETCYMTIDGTTFRAILYPYIGELRYYLENYRDYVYLPGDDMVIPKILAASIPKEQKQKATKELCYTKKTGRFLALPNNGIIGLEIPHLFRKEYADANQYADFDELPKDPDFLIAYLILHLKNNK